MERNSTVELLRIMKIRYDIRQAVLYTTDVVYMSYLLTPLQPPFSGGSNQINVPRASLLTSVDWSQPDGLSSIDMRK